MKKLLFVTLAAVLAVVCVSCSNEDDNDDKSSLVGTQWVTTFSDEYIMFRFVSGNTVEGYLTDKNFVPKNKSTSTYTVNGNSITFNDLRVGTFLWVYKFNTATFDETSMKVTYDFKYDTSKDWTSHDTWNFYKK